MELRKDPITRSWVMVGDELSQLLPPHVGECRFCPDAKNPPQTISTMQALDPPPRRGAPFLPGPKNPPPPPPPHAGPRPPPLGGARRAPPALFFPYRGRPGAGGGRHLPPHAFGRP